MKATQQPAAAWPVRQIVCPLMASTSAAAIRELAQCLGSAPGVIDVPGLVQAIESRESQARTYLGGGVAMPHARTAAVERLVVAVGVSQRGLDWGMPQEFARLIFLVGVPRDEDSGYMAMVRRITQAVRNLDWIERAVACPNASALARLLESTIQL